MLLIFAMFFECCKKTENEDSGIYNIKNAENFIRLAKKGNIKAIDKFLDKGVNINATNEYAYDALMEASYNNDIKTVSHLLSKGADPINNLYEWNALFIVSHLGYNKILNKFIQKNVDINTRSKEHGYTPLFLATIAGNYETALILLKAGADPNIALNEGITPLMACGVSGDMKMMRILIDHKADLWALDKDNQDLYEIARSYSNTRITGLIKSMQKPVIKAVIENDMQTLRTCVMANSMNVNVKDSEGKSALMYASERGNCEMVKLLIDMHADINMADITGYNALMEAIESQSIDIIEILIDSGINVNSISSRTYPTALHLAVTTGRYDIVELLIYAGADLNAQTKNGYTPLMFATEYGHKDISHLLIDCGAKTNLVNKKGEDTFTIAKQMQNTECIK